MGLSRTGSDIDGDFSRKSQDSPSLELDIVAGDQKLESWGYRAEKKFDDIFSRLDTIHQRDVQTDGRTSGDSKDRAYA